MKKIINQPSTVVDEMLDGLCLTHHNLVRRLPDTNVIYRTYAASGKVGLVSGGGSGHEPAHAGFVGKNMLSAAVCGEVFTSPTPDQILEGIKQADQGAGVLLIVKNYSGDTMNFEMAQDMAEDEGMTVDHIVVNDDISLDADHSGERRGVAGTIFVHKILGAAAENGLGLSELKHMGQKLIDNMATLGVSLSPATVPETGKPGFELAEDEMEFGIGIHGEPGYRRETLKSSKAIAKELVEQIKNELQFKHDDRLALMINGLGATPLMEQFILMKDVHTLLEDEAISVDYKKTGNIMTSLEMAGVSVTMLRLEQDEWLDYLNTSVDTPTPF